MKPTLSTLMSRNPWSLPTSTHPKNTQPCKAPCGCCAMDDPVQFKVCKDSYSNPAQAKLSMRRKTISEKKFVSPSKTVGRASAFIDSILALQPKIAVFDCDGTLWSGDAGETFFAWEQEENLVPVETMRAMRARYADYKAGSVAEEVMCAELVTMHKGLIEADVQRAATRFFDLNFVEQ